MPPFGGIAQVCGCPACRRLSGCQRVLRPHRHVAAVASLLRLQSGILPGSPGDFQERNFFTQLIPFKDRRKPLFLALPAVKRCSLNHRILCHLLEFSVAIRASIPSMNHHCPNHPYSIPPQPIMFPPYTSSTLSIPEGGSRFLAVFRFSRYVCQKKLA